MIKRPYSVYADAEFRKTCLVDIVQEQVVDTAYFQCVMYILPITFLWHHVEVACITDMFV